MNTQIPPFATAQAAINPHVSKRKRPTKPPSQREQLILFALGEHERYGLEIQDTITEASNGAESITIGSLYPTLQTLEKKGFVSSRPGTEVSDERCDRKRKYFRLTDAGKAVVEDILAFQKRLLSWGD